MKRGDILTIAAQGDDGKPRPAVVVQSDALNAADSVLVAPFISVIADAPLYRLTIAPTATNGVKAVSQVMVDKVLACPRAKCGPTIGCLPPADMPVLNAMLSVMIGLADQGGIATPHCIPPPRPLGSRQPDPFGIARPMQIVAPDSMLPHVNKVLQGEYDIDYTAPAPVVVDLGANVGSFAAWALHKWPNCVVHCYEPLPSNFELLRRNLGALEGTRVHLNNCAIGDPSKTLLFLGQNNCGEASFFDLGEQGTEQVEVVTRSPDCLPKGQVLKLDTEGSEVDILSRMDSIDYDIVLMEFHGDDKRRAVDAILIDYVLAGGEIMGPHRGILKYVHKRLLPS